jgi:predicted kinase
MLIVLGGLPGTGKTTVARGVALALGAVHLRIDTIEQALRDSGELKGEVGPAGYLVAYGVAEDNLRLGRTVIADSVNPIELTRAAWRAVAARAGVAAVEIEIVCTDPAEHRRRVATRHTDIAGHRLPNWADVVGRDYAVWETPHRVIDTAANTAAHSIAEILAVVRYRSPEAPGTAP